MRIDYRAKYDEILFKYQLLSSITAFQPINDSFLFPLYTMKDRYHHTLLHEGISLI